MLLIYFPRSNPVAKFGVILFAFVFNNITLLIYIQLASISLFVKLKPCIMALK